MSFYHNRLSKTVITNDNNVQQIGDNKTNIETNVTNIEENKTNIATNLSSIGTNATNIETNTTNNGLIRLFFEQISLSHILVQFTEIIKNKVKNLQVKI